MNKHPRWLIAFGIITLIWNAIGVFNFSTSFLMGSEAIAELDEMSQRIINEQPLWSWIGFGLATIGGFLGCIGLLMKKKWCYGLFLLSIIGIMINSYYSYIMSDAMEAVGPARFIMPTLILTIAILLILVAKKGIREEWLR
jgi:hypothetical protein